MVRAWYLKNITNGVNREEENFAKPGEEIDIAMLIKLTGCTACCNKGFEEFLF